MSLLKKIAIIGTACVAIGYIFNSVVKVSVYIEAPKNIEANTQDIYDIQAWINEKRIENQLLQNMQKQQPAYPNQGYRQQEPEYPLPPHLSSIGPSLF